MTSSLPICVRLRDPETLHSWFETLGPEAADLIEGLYRACSNWIEYLDCEAEGKASDEAAMLQFMRDITAKARSQQVSE